MPRLVAFALLLLFPVVAQAQSAPVAAAVEASAPLKARIEGLIPILRGQGDYDAYFSEAFRAQVPKAQFDALTAQIAASAGPVEGIEKITPADPWGAQVLVGFRDGVATMLIRVNPAAPHVVEGLRFTGISPRAATIDAVQGAIRTLPGSTGFVIARLGSGAPQRIAADNADRPLAIGSAFKLVILAELVRSINAGERHWDDKVTLDGRPLPGGTYTLMPAGTQFTLRELASRMISISDNSATDILLFHLGRTRVEAMVRVTGIADPRGMMPFMSTLEMFKLKGIAGLADRYLGLDASGRRLMLDGEVAQAPLTAISPILFQDGKPVLIDRLEWFASPADMVRLMDWLRRNSASGPGAEARAILGINPGLPPATVGLWKSVGYKGGSEPGVIHMTYLLEARDGSWTVVSGSWNNPAAAVEDVRFAGLMSKAAELAVP